MAGSSQVPPAVTASRRPRPAGVPDRDARLDVLDIHLEAAVPLRIFELGPLSAAERLRLAAEASAQIAAREDNILFPGPRRGDTASAVSWLVTGLAVAAFQPGGVRFRQLAWCAAHLGHRWAPDEYPCSACLAQEAEAAHSGPAAAPVTS